MRPSFDTLRRHVRRAPRDAARHHHLARALVLRERPAEALHHAETAVRLEPRHVTYREHAARLLTQHGRLDAAVGEYLAAAALEPTRAEVWRLLASLYTRSSGALGDPVDALVRAIACAPASLSAYIDLFVHVLQQADSAEAMRQVARLVEGRGRLDACEQALAAAVHELGRHHECIERSTALLAARPDDKLLRLTRALSRTALRDVDGASADLDEAVRRHAKDRLVCWTAIMHRIRVASWADAQAMFQACFGTLHDRYEDGVPAWDGRDAQGRTLLIAQDAGYGDIVQFGRFATLAADRGMTVLLECQPSLTELMGTVSAVSAAVRPHDPVRRVDMRTLAAHVGLWFAPSGYAADDAYLRPSDRSIELWRQRLGARRGFRIGVTWATGSEVRDPYRARSVSFDLIRMIADVPGTQVYSLQVGPDVARLRETAGPRAIVDIGSRFRSFADTAAAMANLDLVISVDTSVAHVAGAIGRPCWVLLSRLPCWRWGLESEQTQWYRSLRLFRQQSAGDWGGVLAAVCRELRVEIEAKAASLPRSGAEEPASPVLFD